MMWPMDRTTKIRMLISDWFEGSQRDFSLAIDRSPSQVNQWLSGYRAVGDAGVRNIELKLGLPIGWFDDESSPPKKGENIAPFLNPTAQSLITELTKMIGSSDTNNDDARIREVINLMRRSSDIGKAIILDKARDVVKEYPNKG